MFVLKKNAARDRLFIKLNKPTYVICLCRHMSVQLMTEGSVMMPNINVCIYWSSSRSHWMIEFNNLWYDYSWGLRFFQESTATTISVVPSRRSLQICYPCKRCKLLQISLRLWITSTTYQNVSIPLIITGLFSTSNSIWSTIKQLKPWYFFLKCDKLFYAASPSLVKLTSTIISYAPENLHRAGSETQSCTCCDQSFMLFLNGQLVQGKLPLNICHSTFTWAQSESQVGHPKWQLVLFIQRFEWKCAHGAASKYRWPENLTNIDSVWQPTFGSTTLQYHHRHRSWQLDRAGVYVRFELLLQNVECGALLIAQGSETLIDASKVPDLLFITVLSQFQV